MDTVAPAVPVLLEKKVWLGQPVWPGRRSRLRKIERDGRAPPAYSHRKIFTYDAQLPPG